MNTPELKLLILDFIETLSIEGYDVAKIKWSPMAERDDSPNIDFIEDYQLSSYLDKFLSERNPDKRDVL